MRKRYGFTLIELLVVMAVVGLLAVVVIAMLQPGEQLRKSRDTKRRADAKELYEAYERYLTSFQEYPWALADPTQPIPGAGTAVNPEFVSSPPSNSWMLVERSEVKKNFPQRQTIQDQDLWVSLNTLDQVSVCFEPESKAARGGGMGPIKNRINGVPGTPDCDQPYGVSTQCFVCVP